MKKIILSLILISLVSLPVIGLAVEKKLKIETILDRITNWLLGILLAIAVIFLIIAGYYFVTSMGDPERIKKSRDFVLWALVGVVVGLASKAMVTFIEKVIG